MNNFTAPTDIFNKTGTGTCGGGGGGRCEGEVSPALFRKLEKVL